MIASGPAAPGPDDGERGGATQRDGAEFELYDLRIEVVAPPGARIYCGSQPGDYFELRGEMLHLPPGQGFSLYSLAALLPLLPAKQRATDPNDWMSTDAEVACPDPNCPTRFRIQRLGKRRFKHAETTAVPLPPSDQPK
ncbi:MAG TPA: TIGR04076 family protein [Dongiaceae bacterium]|nr:TIGR04076 family protein [Dongiaceae bacterium]